VTMWSRVCMGTGAGLGLPYPYNTVPLSTGLRVSMVSFLGEFSFNLRPQRDENVGLQSDLVIDNFVAGRGALNWVSSASVSVIFGLFPIIVVILRCRRDERPAFVCSLSVLTSFLEGGFQEMVCDLGEFFIFIS
jgi:hypothetical protein